MLVVFSYSYFVVFYGSKCTHYIYIIPQFRQENQKRRKYTFIYIIYLYSLLRYSVGEIADWFLKNLQKSAWEEKPSLPAISCTVKRVVSR